MALGESSSTNCCSPSTVSLKDQVEPTGNYGAASPIKLHTGASKVTKRTDYVSWDLYFTSVAALSAQRSKDPNKQVGACIVNQDKKIVGIGYNGFPTGCSDDALPWAREGDSELDTKFPYVCHAELNAIMNKNSESLKGCCMYVTLYPCNECAKLIIQSGIGEVVYVSDKHHNKPQWIASRRMMELAQISTRQFTPPKKKVVIDFEGLCHDDSLVFEEEEEAPGKEVDAVDKE